MERGLIAFLVGKKGVQPTNPEGGYFGVPRMVLCYIQFLGLLLEGWDGAKKDGGKDHFGTSGQAKKYIKNVLSQIDTLYGVRGNLLYDMYRHGTVHVISPKKMQSKKYPARTIEWLLYKGDREQCDYYEDKAIKLKHLHVYKWEKNRFILCVSIINLYKDLLISIELYRKMIYRDTSGKLLNNFLSVVDALDTDFDETVHDFWTKATKIEKNS